MQRPKSLYTRKVTVRYKAEEFELLLKKSRQSTERQLSGYVRKVSLGKPVVAKYRNESIDSVLPILIPLKNELHAIGNNFNQSVKKLHSIDTVPEIKTWLALNEASKQLLFKKIEEIRLRMNELYHLWLQK